MKTLRRVKTEDTPIILLDDSYLIKNRKSYKTVTDRYPNVTYHGKEEQQDFFKRINLNKKLIGKFTNRLGVKQWNLGFCRNYALLLAKSLHMKKVLFMDDDIIVENRRLISEMFHLLEGYDFVGARITGMHDDSMVGYIVRELNQIPEEYFSGGFIAFKPHCVSEYFINLYNEDWIWLYFHQIKYRLHQYGEVKQLAYDNFKNANKKVKSQEIGEIIVDGIREVIDQQNFDSLKKSALWTKMLTEKQDYYKHLKNLSLKQNKTNFCRILASATNYLSKLNPGLFSDIFNDYFRERTLWQKLLKDL